jgi:hypothetical protein
MRTVLSLPLLALLGACAASASVSGGGEQGPMSAESSAAADRALAGRVAGAPENCIPATQVTSTRVLADDLILYEGRGRTDWLNRTRGSCGLKPYLSIRRQGIGGSICAGEIINVFDARNGMDRGSCGLGEFVPYEKAR